MQFPGMRYRTLSDSVGACDKSMRWRLLWRGLPALALCVASATHGFQDKPVRIIVPFSAGTITDTLAREVGQVLASQIKHPVIIENRTGAEGTLGAQAVLSAEPDGHTVMFGSFSLTVLDPLMKRNLPYDPVRDFAPVCAIARIDNVMNIHAARPYPDVVQFLAAAKAQPEKFTFAYSSGTLRLAGELFAQSAGIKMVGVPYRSTAAGLADVASGEVDLMFIDQASAKPFYQSGKIRPLVVAGSQRLRNLPEVPSAEETGVPGYKIQPWFAFYASAKTPVPILQQLRHAVAETLKTPAMASVLQRANLQEFSLCGNELKSYMQDDIERMARVIRVAGIEKQ